MKTAFVITCNDAVIAVVPDASTAQADQIKDRLRREGFARGSTGWLSVYPKNWNALSDPQRELHQWEAYLQRCHWAARSTPIVTPSG